MHTVRAFLATDADAVDLITTMCTRELRKIYTPRNTPQRDSGDQPQRSRIVAVNPAGAVVGVAECLYREAGIYVQGIAVAPAHRRRGVAASLLAHCDALAARAGLPAIELSTIKETGNPEVFRRLGFLVVAEKASERFRSPDEQPVTEVSLRRRIA